MSTESRRFFLGSTFAEIYGQTVSVWVNTLSNTNLVVLKVKWTKKLKYFLLSLYLHQTLNRTILIEIWVKIFLPKPLKKDKRSKSDWFSNTSRKLFWNGRLKQGSFLHEHARPLTCQRARDQWQQPCCIVIGTKLFTLKSCLRLKW